MTKRFEVKMMPPDWLAQMGCLCAWNGCTANYKGAMPKGWVALLTYWSKRPVANPFDVPHKDMPRDCSLCPEHAAALEALLKPLGRELDAPAAGRA